MKIRSWLDGHPFRLLGWTLTALMLVLMLLLGSAIARADTVEVSWTAPTERVDGTALPATEIAGYRLSWTLNGTAQSDLTVPPGTSYTLDTGTQTGRVCLVMRTVDTDGLESVATGEVCRKARPRPPGSMRAR